MILDEGELPFGTVHSVRAVIGNESLSDVDLVRTMWAGLESRLDDLLEAHGIADDAGIRSWSMEDEDFLTDSRIMCITWRAQADVMQYYMAARDHSVAELATDVHPRARRQSQ